MKTAENKIAETDFIFSLSIDQRKIYNELKKSFQLESYRAGGLAAAKVMKEAFVNPKLTPIGVSLDFYYHSTKKAILTHFNQLTEMTK